MKSKYDEEITEDLVKLDTLYKEAEEDTMISAPPDGSYIVRVEKVTLSHSKKGNLKLAWKLKILSNSGYKNHIIWKQTMLTTANNLKWFKIDLGICGLELKNLSDLPFEMHKLENITLEILKQTVANGFVNIYFKYLLPDEMPSEINVDNSIPSPTDDIPF